MRPAGGAGGVCGVDSAHERAAHAQRPGGLPVSDARLRVLLLHGGRLARARSLPLDARMPIQTCLIRFAFHLLRCGIYQLPDLSDQCSLPVGRRPLHRTVNIIYFVQYTSNTIGEATTTYL